MFVSLRKIILAPQHLCEIIFDTENDCEVRFQFIQFTFKIADNVSINSIF